MKHLSILIKPASGNCNLRCKYCFYHDVSENRKAGYLGYMDMDIAEHVIKKAFGEETAAVNFIFQGGEPMLIGLDFYKNFVNMVQNYNKNNAKVQYVIQTNGTLIDNKWGEFLKQNNFLVGVSLDGPKEIHDINRINAGNKGTFKTVMNGINILRTFGVEFNILSTVTSLVGKHPEKVYNFFKKNGFYYLQFTPCLDPLGQECGNEIYSLTPKIYGNFLKILFDLWYEDLVNKRRLVSIRYYENIIMKIAGLLPECCGISGKCSIQFVVEADGSVYPCDFYVIDNWYLGNIKDLGYEEIQSLKKAEEFISESASYNDACSNCKWNAICSNGGCKRYRNFQDGRQISKSYFCQAYDYFFENSIDKLTRLAYQLKHAIGV